jgi:putative pyruvate formate lyase activating enzyme
MTNEMDIEASYLGLYEQGLLKNTADELRNITLNCSLCPHDCGVDRSKGNNGICESGLLPIVSSWSPHFGEERPLVGRKGSGTIFFTHCNLSCIFCQNYDISHLGYGREVTHRDLALMMMSLQDQGCHNINFVTPTHMVYAIVEALVIAVPMGLRLPLVYNSGGYDSVDTLKLLNRVFDIYMPDFKYADADKAFKLSGIKDYPEVVWRAITEMYQQVGDLEIDAAGVAYKGLLVRHLVLPGDLAGTRSVVDLLAGLSKNTYLNIMDQYKPEYRAREYPELRRRVTLKEFDDACAYAKGVGMTRTCM